MPYIGVPNGQVVFRGFDPKGRARVQTRTTQYTLPAGIRDPKAIKAWVVRQVKSGAIGTQLYPKQGEYKPERVAAARKRVVKTLDSPIVWRRQVVALNSELKTLPGAERAALVKGLAKDSPKRLGRWISEAISPGWLGLGPLGGLSPKQRKELFSALVKDQNPKDLRTIAKAAGSQGKMNEFVRAVASDGSREQRQGLFIELAKDARTGAKDAERSRAELYNTLGKPKVVFDGRDAAGRVRVRMLGSRYTLPSSGKAPDVAIKSWVGSVDTGGIAKSTALSSRGKAPDVEIKSRVGKVDPGGIANPIAPTGKAYDSRKVSAAYQIFEKALGGIGFGGRNRTVRLDDEFKALNGAERKALVNLLATRRGGTLLEGWIDASRGQRKEFYRAIVEGQDPTNLKRIAKVEIKRDKWLQYKWGAGNAGGMSDFMQAVAQHGTWQQRHGLFMSLVDNAKRGTPGAARLMAELFAGLQSPREVEATFTALDRPATDAMVAAGLDSKLKVRGQSLYSRMAKVASLSSSATKKAAFVAASGRTLLTGGEGVRRDRLMALSGLVRSDPSGVIDSTLNQFSTHGSSSGRRALYNYIEGMYDSADPKLFSEAEAILISLQRGPNKSTDPHVWLNNKSRRNGEEPAYHRARLLGAYTGIFSNVAGKRDRYRNFWAPGAYIGAATGLDAAKESAGWLGDKFPGRLGGLATPKGKAVIGIGVVVAKAFVAFRLLFWRSDTQKDEGNLWSKLQRQAVPKHVKTGASATAPWVATYGESFTRNRFTDD